MPDIQGRNNRLNRSQQYTLAQFDRDFPDDDSCLEFLKEQRWPDGVTTCEKCRVERKHHRVHGRTAYACDYCGNHIYPLAGTIFEKTTTGLRLWFHAMYQMGSTRCGISAKQIQRETGVTYKTAWRMFKQIRSLMEDDPELSGTVEMDETYFGGRIHGKGRGLKLENKTPIVGIVERHGRIVAKTAPGGVNSWKLLGMVKEYVMPYSTVFTDEAPGYDRLAGLKGDDGKSLGYRHRRVHHSAGVYVMGDVHTNTIEGFWSLVKRGIGGTHHSISAKFLQDYLNEYAFRYNRRNAPEPMFKMIVERVAEKAR